MEIRPDGTIEFHRDQRSSAIQRVVLLAIMVGCAAVLRTVGAYLLAAPFVIWLVPTLLTINRQNRLWLTNDSVSWNRRGRRRTLDLATVRSVEAKTVTVRTRNTASAYVVISFRLLAGGEIQTQALFGKLGTPNAEMVEAAVAQIEARLHPSLVDRPPESGPDARGTSVVEPGPRTFVSRQIFNLDLYVFSIITFAMALWLIVVANRSHGGIMLVVFVLCALFSIVVFFRLTRSLRVTVDDDEVTIVGPLKTRTVRIADLEGVFQTADVTGRVEMSVVMFVYPGGTTERCEGIAGENWPGTDSWTMVLEAVAVIESRIRGVHGRG